MNLIKKGMADVTRYVMLVDSATGVPETGYDVTTLDLQYTRNRTAPAAKVDATALAATDSIHGDNKAIQIDATSSPGLYRVDWPDAAFLTGVDKVILVVSGTGLHPAVEEIQLVDFDPADGVRLGLTAIPSAAADAAGGLPVSDAGGLDMDAMASGIVIVDGIVDSILVDTAEIGAGGAGLTVLATAANLATVDGIVDSILLDTAEIGAAGAGLTVLASAANLATVDGIVDSILVDTAEIGAAGAGLTTLATAANLAIVDTVVDTILIRVQNINAAAVTLQSPINQEGNLELISGDSYSLTLTKTSYAGSVTASSPTATAHFAVLDVDNYDDTDAVPNLAIACTFTATTQADGSVTIVITVPITAAQTDSLAGRPPEDRFAYEYQVYLKDGAARSTIQMGKLTIVSKVAPV